MTASPMLTMPVISRSPILGAGAAAGDGVVDDVLADLEQQPLRGDADDHVRVDHEAQAAEHLDLVVVGPGRDHVADPLRQPLVVRHDATMPPPRRRVTAPSALLPRLDRERQRVRPVASGQVAKSV